MQLVSPETGQSLQLVHMDEIRPLRGGIFIMDLIGEIAARYRFQSIPFQMPNPTQKIDANQTLKFEVGAFIAQNFTIPITTLELYSDGLIINARNTDDADLVMDDFIAWIRTRYQLREPKTWLTRRYHSRIIVDLEEDAGNTFITNYEKIIQILAAAFDTDQKLDPQITIGPNPPGELPMSRTWVFQPRIGQPYVPMRYFSSAPLATDKHLRLLCDLEEVGRAR